jgi:YHS domain-containing protein
MRFILALFAILAAFLLLRTLLTPLVNAVAALLAPAPETPKAEAPPAPRAAELKKDPVCGAFIAPELAVTEKHQGQVVHFCSQKCRDEYLRTA